MDVTETEQYDIVPTALAVTAMRDNGYKNAAYAIAELMDNSIQAGATSVDLICADAEIALDRRTRRRLHRVAVLDNGRGMDEKTLQIALQFGNGTRLDMGPTDTGMGKFGMGLPSASISQCQRVEVWSWQNGVQSALYSYLDLNEIKTGQMRGVPKPRALTVPAEWLEATGEAGVGPTGTLVVWSQIDRSMWRTSKALIDNSEEIIGRMYRDWLSDGRVCINLRSYLQGQPNTLVEDRTARPNDPLYLLKGTTTPSPFDDEPMFQPFPSEGANEIRTTIRFRGEDHTVVTRLSIAKEEARAGDGAGSKPHGRHAAKNLGVSVVRSGRELELDPGWTTTYDPRERWWGVEVRFEPGLDELFGVTNNKQSARNFAEAARFDTDALVKQYGSITKARQALAEDEDPMEPLLEVVHRVQTNIREMRGLIKVQAEGRRRRKRHEASESPEAVATEAVRRRQQDGHVGQSDDAETMPAGERTLELASQLEYAGHTHEAALALAAETIDKGLKYRVEVASLEGGAFFSVQPRGGVLLVTLNTDHPAYDLLLGARQPDSLPSDVDELKTKLLAAQSGLETLLFAWARYEDEQVSGDARRVAQNIRHDWGRMAESFLQTRS